MSSFFIVIRKWDLPHVNSGIPSIPWSLHVETSDLQSVFMKSPSAFRHQRTRRTHTHTCSEISYRITDVECISRAQNNPVKLTGMFGRFEVRNLSKVFLQLSSDAAQYNWSILTTSAKVQIAKTVQALKIDSNDFGWIEKEFDLEVLGLSLFPFQKNWQVRHGDQPWYPHVLWPLRWTIAHSTWMVPLQW